MRSGNLRFIPQDSKNERLSSILENGHLASDLETADESPEISTPFRLQSIVKVPLSFAYPLPEKPFIAVRTEDDLPACARKMVEDWSLPTPNVIVSVLGGTRNFEAWKREDHRAAFQKGFMKVVRSMEVWILHDGLNYGMTRLLGTAIKNEDGQRIRDGVFSDNRHIPPRKNPRTLIGISPCSLLLEAEHILASTAKNGNEAVEVTAQKNQEHRRRFGLHWHHTHFVFLETPYQDACTFRPKLERLLQKELSKGSNDFPEEKSDFTLSDQVNATALRYPSDEKVPLVVMLFQGDLAQVYTIRQHLENRVPVILLEGCGYLADIMAYAVRERDAVGLDRQTTMQQLSQRLLEDYGDELRGRDAERMNYVEKIMECAKMSLFRNPVKSADHIQLITIVDCAVPVHDFSDVDKTILKAVIYSQSSAVTSAHFDRNLQFTIQCNRPEFAKIEILNKKPWKKMQIPNSSFEAALLQANREEFVDMFLQQDFTLHQYLSHLKLVKLFRYATDKEFFMVNVWGHILQQTDEFIPKSFVEEMLPPLLHNLARFPVAISAYALSMNSLGKYLINSIAAERQACLALIAWASLMNRGNLAKLLCKYCDEPVPTAIFISAIYRGLASHQRDYELEQRLSARRKELAVFATDILDLSVKDQATDRVDEVLNERFQDFGLRTPIQMAYDSNNKWFLAHPSCQVWLSGFFMGDIRVSEPFTDLKVLLSALLIFPMYFWVYFPKYDKLWRMSTQTASIDISSSDHDINVDPADTMQRMTFIDELHALHQNELLRMSTSRHRVPKRPAKHVKYQNPPLWLMIKLTWQALVTKFWTFQLFYAMFCVLLGVATMMPNCRNYGLNFAVLGWTSAYLLECIFRVGYEYYSGIMFSWWYRLLEIMFLATFVVLFTLFEILLATKYSVKVEFGGANITHFFGAFAGRIVLCFGVLYFYYRVITLFFPISRTLGPMLFRIHRMLSQDFVIFLKLMLPFFVANIIVLQSTMYPDLAMSAATWQKGFYRAFFSIFIAPMITELDYLPRCDKSYIYNDQGENLTAVSLPNAHCLAGHYSDASCPTVTWFSYGFTIQFMIILRLILLVILTAMFNNTLAAIKTEADAIWKYQRYSLIMQFASRPPLPPPFSMIGYLYMLIKAMAHRRQHSTSVIPELYAESSFAAGPIDLYSYWMNLTKDYFNGLLRIDNELSAQQVDRLKTVGADLVAQRKILGVLRDRMDDVGRMATAAAFEAQTVRHKVRSMNVMNPFSTEAQVHIQSRQSPYPDTGISRFSLLDDYCSWEIDLGIYDPKEYSKPVELFPDTERSQVDETKSTATEQVYQWNTVDKSGAAAVDRNSWLKGDASVYAISKSGTPLNPYGRTGIQGRGNLHHYGPNHSVRLILVCRGNAMECSVAVEANRRGVTNLPQTLILCGETETDALLRLAQCVVSIPDLSELLQEKAPLGFIEKLQDYLLTHKQMTRMKDSPDPGAESAPEMSPEPAPAREVYRGYVDDPRNTDNAWLEGVFWLIWVPKVRLDGYKVCRWVAADKLTGLPEFDMLVLRHGIHWKE